MICHVMLHYQTAYVTNWVAKSLSCQSRCNLSFGHTINQRRNHNFFLGGGEVRCYPGSICILGLILKLMLWKWCQNLGPRHLVRLYVKSKLTEKKNNTYLHILKLLYSYVGYSESKYRLRISLAHPRDCHFAHAQWLPLSIVKPQAPFREIRVMFMFVPVR